MGGLKAGWVEGWVGRFGGRVCASEFIFFFNCEDIKERMYEFMYVRLHVYFKGMYCSVGKTTGRTPKQTGRHRAE